MATKVESEVESRNFFSWGKFLLGLAFLLADAAIVVSLRHLFVGFLPAILGANIIIDSWRRQTGRGIASNLVLSECRVPNAWRLFITIAVVAFRLWLVFN